MAIGMFPFVVASSFLPLVIAAAEKVLRKPVFKNFVVLASVLSCILLTRLQIFLFTAIMLALFLIVRCLFSGRFVPLKVLKAFLGSVIRLFVPVVLVLGTTAFWFLPYNVYGSYFTSGYSEYLREISGSVPNIASIFDRTFAMNSGFGIYAGLSLTCVSTVALLIKEFRKNLFAIYFFSLSILMTILSVYQIELLKLLRLENLPLVSMIMPMRYLWVLALSLSFLFGGALKFLSKAISEKLARNRRLRRAIEVCVLVILIIVALIDF